MDRILRSWIPACAIAAMLGLPLLQAIIWYTGYSLNEDVLNQFSLDIGNRDALEGFYFYLVFGGVGQIFFGLVLGSLTGWAASSAWPWRRVCLLLLGATGSCFFAFCLWNGWSFANNHCGPDGCDATSPLTFDFPQIVAMSCPLLWCLGTLCCGLLMQKPPLYEFEASPLY